jgi:RimJ/RimL family protein N-acetyltransferase
VTSVLDRPRLLASLQKAGSTEIRQEPCRKPVTVVFSTQRLILSALEAEDANDLFEVRGDPEAMAFWDWPHDVTPGATAIVVAKLISDVAAGDALVWTVRLRSNQRFWGCVI